MVGTDEDAARLAGPDVVGCGHSAAAREPEADVPVQRAVTAFLYRSISRSLNEAVQAIVCRLGKGALSVWNWIRVHSAAAAS